MIFCVEDEQNICELEVYTLQSVGMEAQGGNGTAFRNGAWPGEQE